MRIGRCDGLNVAGFNQSNGVVDMTLTTREGRTASDVSIQQINGHIGSVVPVIGDDCDPVVDGLYEVLSAAVTPFKPSSAASGSYTSNGLTALSVSLRRVASPALEVLGPRSERPSDLTLTSADLTATWSAPSPLWSSGVADPRIVVGGEVYAQTVGTNDVDYDADFAMRSGVDPGDFYQGAATIEELRDGVWYPVVGRRPGIGTSVRLSNGLLRVWMDDRDLKLQHALADGTDWGNVFSFFVDYQLDSFGWQVTPGFAVIRESTQTVAVKLIVRPYDDLGFLRNDSSTAITLRLDRGQDHVEVYYDSLGSDYTEAQISTPSAGTLMSAPFTRCAYATTADGNGHRWVTVSPRTSIDGTGVIYTNTNGIGLGVTPAAATANATVIAKKFFLAEDQVETVIDL